MTAVFVLALFSTTASAAIRRSVQHPSIAAPIETTTLPQNQRIDVIDFSQCSNGASPSTSTACDAWINGILNPNNSHYAEDNMVAQRAVWSVPALGPRTGRTITIRYQSRKGGIHAYDSVGTWDYTQTTADRCQGLGAGECPGGGASTFPVPDDPTVVADLDGPGSAVSGHQIAGQMITMYGGTITDVSVPVHSDPGGDGDEDASFTVTYSVAAGEQIVMLLLGGHTAATDGPRGWGTGLGSGNVSGGPYHFHWDAADGTSVGKRDNQIQSSALVCDEPEATPLSPVAVCAGTVANFSTTVTGTGPFEYLWRLDGDVIPGATSSSLALNTTGLTPGDHTIAVEVTGECGADNESTALTIYTPTSTTALSPDTACEGETANFSTTPSGQGPFTYVWKLDGVVIPGETSSSLALDTSGLSSGAHTVRVEVTGACNTAAQETTLTISEETSTTDLSPVTACEGDTANFSTTASGTGPFTYVWKLDGDVIPGETTSSLALDTTGLSSGAHTVRVEVTGACNTAAEEATLTINEDTSVEDLLPIEVCEGEVVEVCAVADGTGPFTYSWLIDGVEVGTEECVTIDTGLLTPGVHTLRVEVTGECNTAADETTLTVNEDTSITELTPVQVCEGDTAVFETTASGTGPFTYVWYLDGVELPGESGSMLELDTTGLTEGDHTVAVEVTGECSSAREETTLTIDACDEFCSLTQGAYGNANGQFWFEGMLLRRLELIEALIDGDPLVVGVLGERSLTIDSTDAQCIIDRLPAGGPASALPDFGDQSLTLPSCNTTPSLLAKKGTRFGNVLLGQVITLSLNVRLDPELTDAPLCEFMLTTPALPGPDGELGTDDDIPDPLVLEPALFTIPESVLDALGPDADVGDLLALANDALAGIDTGVPLSDINFAVSAVNEAFDECAFLSGCLDELPLATIASLDATTAALPLCSAVTVDAGSVQRLNVPREVLSALDMLTLPRTVAGLAKLESRIIRDRWVIGPVTPEMITSTVGEIHSAVRRAGYRWTCEAQ